MHNALPQERYTSLAVLMHWAVAVLVFFQLGLGSYMEGLPKGAGSGAPILPCTSPSGSRYFCLPRSGSYGVSAITLAVLVGVHVLAAVAHAVRPGDHLFRRMLPRSLVP